VEVAIAEAIVVAEAIAVAVAIAEAEEITVEMAEGGRAIEKPETVFQPNLARENARCRSAP